MRIDLLPFEFALDTTAIAGASLWSLTLYISLSGLGQWITQQFSRWLNFAEQMYTLPEEFERDRQRRESQNSFYAQILGVIPFLVLGALANWGLTLSLGGSWPISLGILGCIGCGIYELGRRST